MRILLLLCLCLNIASRAMAQNAVTLSRSLEWHEKPYQYTTTGGNVLTMWSFEGCSRGDAAPTLPVFLERIPLNGPSTITATVTNVTWEPFSKQASPDDEALSEDLNIQTLIEQERDKFFGRVRFIPVRKTAGGYERAVSFTLNVDIMPQPIGVAERGGPFTTTSVLRDGAVYKFGVAQTGMYRLDYNFLKTELGISDLDNIDPRTIRLYGNGGAMLPELVNAPRTDDLAENAIFISGEGDGRFNTTDFLLLYATGPDVTVTQPANTEQPLTVVKHLYDRLAWYFIKIGGSGNGVRVTEQPAVSATIMSEAFDEVQRREDEEVNLLDDASSAQGSGKQWFGDYFLNAPRTKTYNFNFPNLVSGAEARFRAEFAGRSGGSSTVRMTADGTLFQQFIGQVAVSDNESRYAREVLLNGTFTPRNDQISVQVDYPEVAGIKSEGWLDYIEITARRRLIMAGLSLTFRDLQSTRNAATLFRIGNTTSNTVIWDITNPQSPRRQQATANGNTLEFGAETRTLRTFIAFAETGAFPKPEAVAKRIGNQNLHGLTDLHMLIVYPTAFEAAAQRLAEHRRRFSGLTVGLAPVDAVFNEFSSGAKDPTAIRDIARMLLERNPNRFDYLLLLGDGSFDPKKNSVLKDKEGNNLDWIPVFETAESFDPITAFPSDDYFGLLSNGEGGALVGALDIAVGRIPARSAAEADAVVEKIIAYDSDPKTLGDWRHRLVYIADDEDGNPHINQADKLANEAQRSETWFNIEKIYFDAFQQVATSGGQRYPDAKQAINANVFKGALVLQYIGHGGPRGWAQERVVDNNDIAGWENPDRYPLIITATCSFGGYDDYTTLTGGEQALIKARSGAIGLFTTVRAVYISGNDRLTDAVQSVIFKRERTGYRAIGDILKDGKNTLFSGDENNGRRFTLLGDPAMFLGLPEQRIRATRINGKPIDAAKLDTLRALSSASVEGEVTDTLGRIQSNFNGRVFVTVFDKAQTLRTLGQDPGSIARNFDVQRNVIFKGSATVTNGRFKVDFVIPKDINYSFGQGKFSFYAENGTPIDAVGSNENIIIGGNANQIKDDQPPVISVFMNDENFVTGGITDINPKIFVRCSDDFGMNFTGNSLGHDLTAVLDDNVKESIILNEFYRSEQDNVRKGSALYPLRNIEPGPHTLRVKGWDIANNSAEGVTEFIVSESGKAALAHVLNYPNPFTTRTAFQFEHNLAGQLLDVQVSIFSVSGRLVKTLLLPAPVSAGGYRVTDIEWDGRDEYGDALGKGVYLYRVKVRGTDLGGKSQTLESNFEKLVILK
jgi:Peptidase family C25